MKYLKILGLAVIAAMGLMAFLGAGTASATVLCETTPAAGTDCGTGWHVPNGTKLSFSLEPGTSAALKGPFGELIDTCTKSDVEGTLENTGGTAETVKGTVEVLNWTECTKPTTSVPNADGHFGTLEVHHIAGTDNGTVTSTGATVIIHDVTQFGIETCSYETNATDIGTLTGSLVNTPTFDISATIPSEGFPCPNGSWSGKYISTTESSPGVTTKYVVAAG